MTSTYWRSVNLNGTSLMKSETIERSSVWVTYLPRRKLVFLLAYLMYLVIFSLWAVDSWNGCGGPYQDSIFPWVLSSLVINSIGLLWVDKRKYFDTCVWFLFLSYAFMFGHVFTTALDLHTTLLWDPDALYSNIAKLRGSIFAIASLCSFTFGCMVVGAGNLRDFELDADQDGRLFYIGVICTVIGFICSAHSSFSVVYATQLTGSYASYTDASTNGLIASIGFLFVVGVINLLYSNRLSTTSKLFLFSGSVLYFLIVMALSGSRKTGIFAIVALVLAFLASSRKARPSILGMIAAGLFGLLFLDLLYVIRETRFDLSGVVPTFIESLQSMEFLSSLLGESLTEMGLTFYSVVGIVQTVPTVFSYELGMTIVRSACSILPIGWAVGDFFNLGSSTYVINQYLDVPVGASLIGDFYWNWGFVGGCIACFLFGAALAFFCKKLTASTRLLPLYFSISYVTLIGVRAGLFELARPLFIVVITPLLISRFYAHYRLREKK